MRRTNRFRLLVLLGALVWATQAQAQDTAVLTVESNASDAVVLINGEAMGSVGEALTVPIGAVHVVVLEAEAEAWQPRRAEATVELAVGEERTLRLDLPVRYRIETLPVGASIRLETALGTEALGTSPLVLERAAPVEGEFVAERNGFLQARLAPGDSLDNRHVLLLRPLEDRANPEASVGWIPPQSRPNTWIDIAAAGVALAGAAVAIHYKFQADDVDDRYRQLGSPERGDPTLKAEAERLDTYSLAALGVMQIGVGVLAVRFVLR